jgi:hypothetical protein
MTRHALTIATRWSPDRNFLVLLAAGCSLTGCGRNQAIPRDEIPSDEKAWVMSACDPARPDFTSWSRGQIGGVSIAAPPGFTLEQSAPTTIAVRGSARQSSLVFDVERDPRQTFDALFSLQRQTRHQCRDYMGPYPADVVAWYDRGQYGLVARWEATWGSGDEGTWLLARISSTRVEEARMLRAVLHSLQPAGADDSDKVGNISR